MRTPLVEQLTRTATKLVQAEQELEEQKARTKLAVDLYLLAMSR